MKRNWIFLGCCLFLFSCSAHQQTTLDCHGYTGVDYRVYGGHIDERRSFSESGGDDSASVLYYFRPTNPAGLMKKTYLIDDNISIYYRGYLTIGNLSPLKDGLWVEGYFIVAYGGDCSGKEASLSVLADPLFDRIVIPS